MQTGDLNWLRDTLRYEYGESPAQIERSIREIRRQQFEKRLQEHWILEQQAARQESKPATSLQTEGASTVQRAPLPQMTAALAPTPQGSTPAVAPTANTAGQQVTATAPAVLTPP